jgi:hypothetical protein
MWLGIASVLFVCWMWLGIADLLPGRTAVPSRRRARSSRSQPPVALLRAALPPRRRARASRRRPCYSLLPAAARVAPRRSCLPDAEHAAPAAGRAARLPDSGNAACASRRCGRAAPSSQASSAQLLAATRVSPTPCTPLLADARSFPRRARSSRRRPALLAPPPSDRPQVHCERPFSAGDLGGSQQKNDQNRMKQREPEVAIDIRQFSPDGLNHILKEYSIESGCLYPSLFLNQTLDSH